jgi:hypothetical protein
MSSHHFVKEGQEPAVFILDTMAFKYVEPLLEWVPLIMVSDTILDDVLEWGIKIDVVIQCETTANVLEKKVANQFPLEVLPCKNADVIRTGMEFLIQNRIEAVNVISTSTEEIFERLTEFSPHVQIGLFADKKWSLIRSGKLEKWMPSGHQVWLKSTGEALLHTKGILKRDGDWETVESGIVTIDAVAPFWVGEPLK